MCKRSMIVCGQIYNYARCYEKYFTYDDVFIAKLPVFPTSPIAYS